MIFRNVEVYQSINVLPKKNDKIIAADKDGPKGIYAFKKLPFLNLEIKP